MISILADLCTDKAGYKIFGFIGAIVTVIKIVVPIIIVVMGSIDLVKAVVAQKDDEIKKGYSTLLKRVIVGVVIFFIPGIISAVMTLAGNNNSGCASAQCVFKNSSSCISNAETLSNNLNFNDFSDEKKSNVCSDIEKQDDCGQNTSCKWTERLDVKGAYQCVYSE